MRARLRMCNVYVYVCICAYSCHGGFVESKKAMKFVVCVCLHVC